MSTILISINPEYVERIFNGTKKYEYRRRLANKGVNKMIVYCTAPVKAVVGEVTVVGTMSDTPEKLWEQTKDFAGISKEKYFEYFSDKEKANCYVLGDCVKYDQLKKIGRFRRECCSTIVGIHKRRPDSKERFLEHYRSICLGRIS